MTKLRVFLADDHAVLREGLRLLISAQPDMEIAGEAADGEAAIRDVVETRPDVIVMDISMPKLNGVDATRRIRAQLPEARVLVLTAHEDSVYIQLLLEAGASGYLLKRAAAIDLIKAIRAVATGQLYLDTTASTDVVAVIKPVPPARARGSSGSGLPVELSEREAEVLRMIALGYSMQRMAAKLGLSARTLETYKQRGMAKLDLENRADIVRLALQQGWLKDG